MTRPVQVLHRISISAVALAAAALITNIQAQDAGADGANESEAREQLQTPARGYLEAHREVVRPRPLLGGPLKVSIIQEMGGVFVGLPDQRRLDEDVFGTPETPLAVGGFPIVQGVPVPLRTVEGGTFGTTTKPTPFGDKFIAMGNGKLKLELFDLTAADAMTSRDSVQLDASWTDDEGNVYAVRCCDKLETVGGQHPTFGGVVTNHLMHGFSRVGTPLMPTMFTYAAFWGAGEVLKNGEVIDKPRPVHGMLTEYMRKEGYALGFDKDVEPTEWHFHLMLAPVVPDPEGNGLKQKPVETGLTLPNGKPLPFWHVMFETIEVSAERTEDSAPQ